MYKESINNTFTTSCFEFAYLDSDEFKSKVKNEISNYIFQKTEISNYTLDIDIRDDIDRYDCKLNIKYVVLKNNISDIHELNHNIGAKKYNLNGLL